MAIPAVIQGTVEVEGKVFELDSPKGAAWVETIGSFRFEPAGDGKPCTVRREQSGYWYGCRKVAGKVRKKYIGKTSEVNTAKLEEIAAALEVPPVPRFNKVAEVAQEVTQDTQVAEKVVEVAEDRLTALELEVANLRKALEALQEALLGKLESGDSEELPKVDNAVAEELHNNLSNLKADNKWLREKLAESQGTVDCLNWGTEVLNKQLEALRVENQRLQNDLGNSQAEVIELRSQLKKERADREEVEAELADLKQKSATASKDLPEAADLLNQLKAKRKKSTTTLADVEKILEILEGI
jgi:chromosome segregation ATPase